MGRDGESRSTACFAASGFVDNVRADRVRQVRRLQERAGRRRAGRFVAEGPSVVAAAVATGAVRELYVTDGGVWGELTQSVVQAGGRWWVCTPEVFGELCGTVTPQGVLAVCQTPATLWPECVGDVSVMGVGLQDPGNVGTIVRGCDAVGGTGVVLAAGCADVWSPKSVRASVGSVFHVPVAHHGDAVEVALAARAQGVAVLAAAGEATVTTTELVQAAAGGGGPLLGRHLWVVGNEGAGLPAQVRSAAEATVAVPLLGQAESLNVAMATTACLYATVTARALAPR